MTVRWFGAAAALMWFAAACAPVARKPVEPVPDITRPPERAPQFERTFGDVTGGNSGALLVRYKSITVLVDPGDDANLVSAADQADYVLLSDASSNRFNESARRGLRKTIKIVATPEAAETLRTSGFSEVKIISADQRVLLKKNDDFFFLTAAQSRNAESNFQVNSYLLEFDNGRNLLFAGATWDVNALRPLLYAMRDDGKELYAGFFHYSQAKQPATAQVVGLFQPANAVFVRTANESVDQAAFTDVLKSEFFEGPFMFIKEGEGVPF